MFPDFEIDSFLVEAGGEFIINTKVKWLSENTAIFDMEDNRSRQERGEGGHRKFEANITYHTEGTYNHTNRRDRSDVNPSCNFIACSLVTWSVKI